MPKLSAFLLLMYLCTATDVYGSYHVLVADPNKGEDMKVGLKTHARGKRSVPDRRAVIDEFIEVLPRDTGGEANGTTQTMEFWVQNPDVENPSEVILTNTVPSDAILTDFTLHNEGYSYKLDLSQPRGKNGARREYSDAVAAGRSSVMLGGSDVAVLCDGCKETDRYDEQGMAALINVASNDALSVAATFLVPQSEDVSYDSKYSYHTNVTIELVYPAKSVKGLIMSPNYPDSYPNNADLAWLLKVPDDGLAIEATFLSFETEACCDYLYVYDGSSTSDPVLMIAGGSDANNGSICSTGSSMLIKFKSDCAISMGGFAIEFESINSTDTDGLKDPVDEENVIIAISGVISSSGYPVSYRPSSTVSWHVQTAPGTYILFNIVDYDIAPGDVLTIFDPNTSEYVANLVDTTSITTTVTTSGNQATLRFDTGEKFISSYRGFYITFESPLYRCQTDIEVEESDFAWSFLTSPNYPSNYDNDMGCTWLITVPYGMLIRFNVINLDLESGFDFLRIFDGATQQQTTLLSTLSGFGARDSVFMTSQDTALVQFTTDSSITHTGFELSYVQYGSSRYCPSAQSVSEWEQGYVANSLYPYSENYIPDYGSCLWKFVAAEGKIFKVLLEKFYPRYDRSNITFYDAVTGETLFDSAGLNIYNYDFVSASNQVLVNISTGSEYDYIGYLFTLNATDQIVDPSNQYNLSVAPGTIKSPSYPAYYLSDSSSQWFIQAGNNTITLYFEEFQLTTGGSLVVYNGGTIYDSVLKRCSDSYSCDTDDIVTSTSTDMLVVFNAGTFSSSPSGYFKFRFYFSEVGSCSNLVYETDHTSGIATSPNYPNNYPNNYESVYCVSVTEGYVIDYYFEYFVTETNWDYLYLYDGNSTSSPVIETLTGTGTGTSGSSSTNYLTMKFHTDGSGVRSGFLMTYSVSVYSIVPTANQTAYDYVTIPNEMYYYLASPGFPGTYPDEFDFMWYFDGVSFDAYRINFYFYQLDIDSTDFVNIYYGFSTDLSNRRSTISGRSYYYSYYYTYLYNTAQATVWFHSSSAFGGKGFYLRYYAYD